MRLFQIDLPTVGVSLSTLLMFNIDMSLRGQKSAVKKDQTCRGPRDGGKYGELRHMNYLPSGF